MTPWWDDLSGAELLSRLINRGTPPAIARAWVARRDLGSYQERITERIGAEPGR